MEAAKKAVETRKANEIARMNIAKAEQEKAKNDQEAAKALKVKYEQEMEAAKQVEAAERLAHEEEARKYAADLELKKQADIKAIAAAAKKQQEALDEASKGHIQALAQAESARAAQDEKQSKDLADKLAARTLEFKGQYEHVWVNGPTKISMV